MSGSVTYVTSHRSADDYDKIKAEAHKPAKQRQKIIRTSRGKIVAPRRYDADDAVIAGKLEEFRKTGVFQNPLRRAGAYFGFVQALIELGIDQTWTYKQVLAKMEAIMRRMEIKGPHANAWEAFVSRKSRNPLVGNDIFGRVTRNAITLQRIRGHHPYGHKLRQMNACVDILAGERLGRIVTPAYRLNTRFPGYNDVRPTNELTQKRERKKKSKV